MSIKVGFVSLGCPKNLINTETMLKKLIDNGYTVVAEDIDADVVVINTCAFINDAKQEAIDNILDIAWLKENRALKGIVVTGCLPQRYRDEIFKRLPEVDAIIGTGSLDDICKAVEEAYNGRKFSSFGDPSCQSMGGDRVLTTPEHMTYIQIAEGCDNHCSYCVIPDIRGKFRSRPMCDIIEEARNLAELGVKELVLVAQDTTRYGEDIFGTYALDVLLDELSQIDGIEWLRLLYCYPDRITDSLIDVIANNPKVCKYIDMPIQHISNDVLKAMNRRDTEQGIRDIVAKLRSRVPGIILRSTVIVGFPGETKDDFAKLENFVQEIKFERLGVFKYSREENTPAYSMPYQVSDKTKQRRHDILMSAQERIHNDCNKRFIGTVQRVICEGYDQVAECFYGRSFADAYDIDGKIYFNSSFRVGEGEFVDVEITELLDYDLLGRTVGKK